ncbi:hypothetical protein HNQ03_003254 [Chryseobacterium sp. 16F]|uniref:Uncharacterized protein n=1 Tax=Frigoriflavimonas asaccharolytica TaxID=2735899 RepID=A0A8J8GA25_9FLAO|nr:hypothetical protein [Frigoriflavimonas asaccharolytica]
MAGYFKFWEFKTLVALAYGFLEVGFRDVNERVSKKAFD